MKKGVKIIDLILYNETKLGRTEQSWKNIVVYFKNVYWDTYFTTYSYVLAINIQSS